ncbi:MAG TPA: NADH-quinone oxidoreductase subunit NuoF [bacterium]|nr:NADH-quinone oxidoreductase subunit NuoF [bacterium]
MATDTLFTRGAEALKKIRRETVDRPVVFVGAGTCGLGAGAAQTLAAVREWIAAHHIDADIVETGCIGLCAEEPLMDVQLPGRARISFKKVTGEKASKILDSVFKGAVDTKTALVQFDAGDNKGWDGVPTFAEHPFFRRQTRWVLGNCGVIDPESIDEYCARGGYEALRDTLSWLTPDEAVETAVKSGLRGRGGGGFPTGKKWRFARAEKGELKYLVCNADEGDPGAFMDRAVIEGDPYRLLEGMTIAAYAIGAREAYIYIRAEYPLAIKRLERAIAVAERENLLGDKILGSELSLHMHIKMGAGAFVCGEETALIHSIEGKRGMPRPRPPFPAVKGLFGKPTVINNVETFANVPEIFRHGAERFAAVGTGTSTGTKVFALSGKVVNTGLVEVAMGTSIREIVFDIGGGIEHGAAFKAVQIGGPSGGCIPDANLDTKIDYEELKKVGAMMGSGGLVVMDEHTCMVDVAKFFMDFIQRESCGKCIPCREGTRRMLEILQSITRSRRNETGEQALQRFQGIMQLTELAEVIRSTSLCGLGQTAPNPVLSTLKWFRHEYDAHVYDRKCPAGACKDLITYRIVEEQCKGCTLCAKKCPVGAIKGAPKSPHYIIDEKCIRCGACIVACPFKAIETE